MKKFYAFVLVISIYSLGFGQSTYQRVYSILQSNCAATCHSAANLAGGLNLSGTESEVYNLLVNATPNNATAAAAGHKRIDPGAPRNSYLFKKVNQGLDANLTLGPGEGNAEPSGSAALSQVEREIIRQWIQFGAKDTGTQANEQLLTDFYVGQGGQPRIQPLAPPAAAEGMQLYWGPIFMHVGEEFEYANKFFLKNAAAVDVTRMNVHENEESHHYAVYKFHPGSHTVVPSHMKRVQSIVDEATLFYAADVIAQWPNDIDLHYPAGTAYIFDTNSVLDISYHLINYNDSIIAAEAYMNIYYAPHSVNVNPIHTAQIRYGGDDVWDLVIPPNGMDTTFTINQFDPDSNFYWNIISMQAHTHKRGTDYNVWKRNPNGTKGDLIYNGHYDPTYTFDQGLYVWDAPPYRQFSPVLSVDQREGLIHEATFRNLGPDTIGFGLTTNDEMYVTFIVYYKSEFPAGISDERQLDNNLKIAPNPVSGTAYVHLNEEVELKNAEFRLYDLLGNEVTSLKGLNTHQFSLNVASLAEGCYLYRLVNNGNVTATGKVVLHR